MQKNLYDIAEYGVEDEVYSQRCSMNKEAWAKNLSDKFNRHDLNGEVES